jgi:hypothetical protein
VSLSDKSRSNNVENTFRMTAFTLEIYHKFSIDVYTGKKLNILRENEKIKTASGNLVLLFMCFKFKIIIIFKVLAPKKIPVAQPISS